MKNKNNYLYQRPFTTVLIAFALLFFQGPAVQADSDSEHAQILINEMSRASHELNYDGVFVYRRARQMNTMRIIHKGGSEGEHERLVSLTGSAREVVRDGNTVRCFFPEKQAVMVEKSHSGKLLASYLPDPIESIAEHYHFSIAAQDRVAGRNAWVVNIIPGDNLRYGYQLWIDKDTRLMLKSELKNSDGTTLEQIMFTQLDVLDEIPENLLKPSTTGTDYTWYETSARSKNDTQTIDVTWTVNWMPDGFKISEHGTQSMSMSKDPVDHMVLTDGLAMVSIFIEKLDMNPQAEEGPANMGGVNTYAVQKNGSQVTAVGEVPRKTVKLIANSVQIRN